MSVDIIISSELIANTLVGQTQSSLGCLIGSRDKENQHVIAVGVRDVSGLPCLTFGVQTCGIPHLASCNGRLALFATSRFNGWQRLDVVCVFRRQIFILGGRTVGWTDISEFCAEDVHCIGNSSSFCDPFLLPFANLKFSRQIPPPQALFDDSIKDLFPTFSGNREQHIDS